jgi:hypothetical protein
MAGPSAAAAPARGWRPADAAAARTRRPERRGGRSGHRRGGGARPRLGHPRRSRSWRPPAPNRSLAGTAARTPAAWRALGAATRPGGGPGQPPPGPLVFGTHLGSGSQLAGTSSRRDSSARTQASIRSVLPASGASPLTFCASAICTSHPSSSSWSWTNRAPFIDSIAAATGSPNPASCRTSPPSPSASGGTAVTWISSPASFRTCTSNRCRDSSNPGCNMWRARKLTVEEIGPMTGDGGISAQARSVTPERAWPFAYPARSSAGPPERTGSRRAACIRQGQARCARPFGPLTVGWRCARGRRGPGRAADRPAGLCYIVMS